jgi:RecB family exonuclease
MMYYYVVCARKLWYFYHEIQMEQDNENVKIGKIIDETSYRRDNKHINIDNVINIDFIRNQGVLHEVKKSKKIEEAGLLQVKYYLYYLKNRGVDSIKAKIDYPLLKQTLEVELLEKDIEMIEKALNDVENIVEKKTPPTLQKKNICKACAYYDLCYI